MCTVRHAFPKVYLVFVFLLLYIILYVEEANKLQYKLGPRSISLQLMVYFFYVLYI